MMLTSSPCDSVAESSSVPTTETELAAILVVDDSMMDRRLTGRILEKTGEYTVCYANDGMEALEYLSNHSVAAVLTDMQMPEMDGLQLVETIRQQYPRIPVLLMTGNGSEELAIQALQAGAASYVPKRQLAKELVQSLEQILNAAKIDRRQQKLLDSLRGVEYQFSLENDASMVPQLVAYFQEHLTRIGLCDATDRIRVGIALEEALLNGLYHGNLELKSEMREAGDGSYERLGRERCSIPPYMHRRLDVRAKLSASEATFIIRDEGPGFDVSKLPDPTDLANMEKASGRGMLLIRSFMDSVQYNATGNEVTLIKRAKTKE